MSKAKAFYQLINQSNLSYQESKDNASLIDDLLEFNCFQIEKDLPEEKLNQTWQHLDTQIFQTPYTELKEMISHISPISNSLWIDLGAAYGRLGITLHYLRPEENFLGFEFVESRVNEGNRVFKKLNINRAELKHQDLQDEHFIMPEADVYFIYDYGKKEHIYKTLNQLSEVAKKRSIQLFARGLGVRHYIMNDFPWLWAINTPTHTEHWSLFKS